MSDTQGPASAERSEKLKGGTDDDITVSQTVSAAQLRAFVERIERMEEDRKAISDDIKEVYAEMKGTGFDTAAVRQIVAMRRKDDTERQEEESILELYMHALGMA